MKNLWKIIAIGEFTIISIGISFFMFYVAYKQGILSEGVKGVIETLANIAYLVFFFGGATGWMIIIGLWKGDD